MDPWDLVRHLLLEDPPPDTMAGALKNDPTFWRGIVRELLGKEDAALRHAEEAAWLEGQRAA